MSFLLEVLWQNASISMQLHIHDDPVSFMTEAGVFPRAAEAENNSLAAPATAAA